MPLVLFVGGSMDGTWMVLSEITDTYTCYRREQSKPLQLTATSDATEEVKKEIYRCYDFVDVDGDRLNVFVHEDLWKSGKILAHIFSHYTAPGGSR